MLADPIVPSSQGVLQKRHPPGTNIGSGAAEIRQKTAVNKAFLTVF